MAIVKIDYIQLLNDLNMAEKSERLPTGMDSIMELIKYAATKKIEHDNLPDMKKYEVEIDTAMVENKAKYIAGLNKKGLTFLMGLIDNATIEKTGESKPAIKASQAKIIDMLLELIHIDEILMDFNNVIYKRGPFIYKGRKYQHLDERDRDIMTRELRRDRGMLKKSLRTEIKRIEKQEV